MYKLGNQYNIEDLTEDELHNLIDPKGTVIKEEKNHKSINMNTEASNTMNTWALIDCGASGIEIVEDSDSSIEAALRERDRLTEMYGADQARLLARGLSLKEAYDFVNGF